jgi:hypothetical protein
MLKRLVHISEFPLTVAPTPPETPKRRPSRLSRIFDAVVEARQRKAQQDIRRLIGWSDGPLCDEFERRITEHLMRNSTGI